MKALGSPHRSRRARARLLVAALVALAASATVVEPARSAPSTPAAPSVAPAVAPAPAALADPEAPTSGRFIDPVFDDVEVTEDIPYHQAVNVDGELQTLHLDLYEPTGDTAQRRPVVVLIHGGAFVFGDNKDDTWGAGPSIAALFARRGYVAVSIQYRLRPEMPVFPNVEPAEIQAAVLDAHEDAMAAIAWLRDHAAEHRLDPRAIVPNGPSAGGTVAWNLAWMQGSPLRPEPSGVPAAVSIAGAPILRSLPDQEPLATPSPGDAPVLAFHGTDDTVVAFDLAAGPCSAAAEASVRCELVVFEGVGHPGVDPAFADHFATIEQRTFAFLAEAVLAPLGYFDQPSPPEPPEPPEPGEPGEPAGPEHPGPEAPTVRPPRPARPVVAHPNFTG